jgi:hypothetical protein
MSTLLDQIVTPFAECLTPAAAEKVVAQRADAQTQARLDELAAKANRGTLTEEEAHDYDRILAAFHFVTILQARARKLLRNNPA